MEKKPFQWYETRFWTAYFIQMRPYLLFVSGVAGLAGIAAANPQNSSAFVFWAAFFPLFLGYGFGQAFTDCFQIDTDRISAPYRPLSQGILSPKAVATVSLIGLAVGVGLLVYLNQWNGIAGILAVTGLATYTFFKRNYWFAGPPWNAWIVALLPLMGYLAVQREGFINQIPSVGAVMGLTFVSYANFVLMGYLKDISADRESGYHTFTVVFGWERTVWVGHILAIISACLALTICYQSPVALLIWALGTAVAWNGQWYAQVTTDKTEPNAAKPISATVRSFILWHLAAIISMQPDWWPFMLLFYGLFEWTLRKRPSVAQI